MSAEREHREKVIKQDLQLGPDQYDERGLPPQIRKAKKQLKLEQREEK